MVSSVDIAFEVCSSPIVDMSLVHVTLMERKRHLTNRIRLECITSDIMTGESEQKRVSIYIPQI